MSLKILASKDSKKSFLQIILTVVLVCAVILSFTLSAITVTTVKNSAGAVAGEKPKVIIDAGHGGFDGGAVVGDVYEKDINLKIANALSYMLKASGVDVIQTRTNDSSTESNSNSTISSRKKSDLRNRLQIVKSNPDAILVSIHLNKFSSPSAKGAQVFYAPSAENSNILAESIRRNIISLIQKDNSRALKKATKDVYLLYNSTIPAVIVECGFMSNPEDFKNLQAEDYQNRIAFAIFGGILSYLSKS